VEWRLRVRADIMHQRAARLKAWLAWKRFVKLQAAKKTLKRQADDFCSFPELP
jgi:hypothetical protein